MDDLDKHILAELEKNAREPFLQIAKKLKVSEGTIRKRVSDMTKEGIIKRFTVDISGNVSAIIGIQTNPHVRTKEIIKRLKDLKVNKLFELTGRFDILCYISSYSLENVNTIIEEIRAIEGINHTETFTVLNEE